LQRFYRFCRGDGSLTLAVTILIVFVFVLYPLAEIHAVPRFVLDIAFALFLTFGALFVFEPRLLMRAFVGLLLAALVVRIIDQINPQPWSFTLGSLLVLAACAALQALLLKRVLRDGRINLHRIMGAIGSYLLIGLVFAQAYRLLAYYIPGAFVHNGAPSTYENLSDSLHYFSFITLTSTGYGDITPVHPYARSLATLEALSGNLFLAVLIARLVAMEMDWRHDQRDARVRGEAPLP
jgi:hypothetical protein